MSSFDFQVNRADLNEARLLRPAAPSCGEGQALLRVDRFALTANNITYGVAGDMLGYWKFFPAEGPWGRLPVWGIGTVVDTRSQDVNAGDRFYGYFPMSGHLAVEPGRVWADGMSDMAAHRQELAPVYNRYTRMTPQQGFLAGFDNHQMIYRPLFFTSFFIDDFLDDHGFFGAEQVIIASASSKTAIGTAFMMKDRPFKTTGLTSAGNRAFVERLGIYDEVLTYDDVSAIDASKPGVFVDMSGNRTVLEQVHRQLDDNLVYSCGVGITHHEDRDEIDLEGLPGAKPRMFFAPSQIEKRNQEWGAEKFRALLAGAWQSFVGIVDEWITIIEQPSPDSLDETYRQVLNGAPPDSAFVLVNTDGEQSS